MTQALRRARALCAVLLGAVLLLAGHAYSDAPFQAPQAPLVPLSWPANAKGLPPELRKDVEGINDVQKSGKRSDELAKSLRPKLKRVNAAAKREEVDPDFREQVSRLNNAIRQHREAKELSDVTLRSDPDNRDALNNRAYASYGLKDYPSAEADARRAIQVDPADESAFTTLALIHYAQGDYLQAADDARRVLALNKNNETAFYLVRVAQSRIRPSRLHLSSLDQARAEQVEREYEIAAAQQNEAAASLKDAPASAAGLPSPAPDIEAARKLAQRDYWGTIVDTDQLLAESPSDGRARVLRATAYALVGHCEDSLKDANAALGSAEPDAYDARSLAEYCLGRYSDADADASKAIALSPASAYAYLHRARALERMLDLPAALADYRKAAELNAQFEPYYREAVASYGPAPAKTDAASSPPTPALLRRREQASRILWGAWISGTALIGIGLLGVWLSLGRRQRPPETPAVSRSLQNYRLTRQLAEGGMGVVYEAFDEALDRTVAIKRMRDEIKASADSRRRFLEEARTVAALRHPNIMEIFSVLDAPEDLFLVFEYIPGRRMSDRLREGPLSFQEIHQVFRGICSALEYAHRHGVIHRDLKPSNIMITEEGEAKVMDFGIAHHVRQALFREQPKPLIAGTLEYMAPETQQGLIGPEADVYSLAVCLQEAFGRRPLSAQASSLLREALRTDPSRRIGSALVFWNRLAALPDLAGRV